MRRDRLRNVTPEEKMEAKGQMDSFLQKRLFVCIRGALLSTGRSKLPRMRLFVDISLVQVQTELVLSFSETSVISLLGNSC